MGYLVETNRATQYSPRRIQQFIEGTAEQAQIAQAGVSASPPALRGNPALRARNVD